MAGTGRFDYLDGLRAVAICAVLGVHWLTWYVPFFNGGVIGVDLFFVLSGFIITTVLWRSRSTESLGRQWVAFVRRRVVRLYPALLGLVVGAVVLYAVVPNSGVPGLEVARRGLLTLAQATSFWGATQEGSILVPALEPFGHTWSLAVEWYFYLAWPVVLLAVRRRGWSARRTARASAVVAAAVYAASLVLPPFWFYFGPSARFAEILAGGALAAGVPKPVLGLIALALVAGLTYASYRLLEQPFLRARSDVLTPRLLRKPQLPHPRGTTEGTPWSAPSP